MNVGEIWSSLTEKFQRSDRMLKSNVRYKEAPPIPSHKAKVDRGYSVVVIGSTGKSRQYDASASTTGVLIGLVSLTLVFAVIGLVGAGKFIFSGSAKTTQDAAITEKLSALQEELRNKEVALAVYENRMKEQGSLSAQDRSPRDFDQASGASDTKSHQSFKGAIDASVASVNPTEKLDGAFDTSMAETDPKVDSKTSKGPLKSEASSRTTKTQSEKVAAVDPSRDSNPLVNFNTQDVTIAPETPGSGTLSFRLVKDNPNVLFSGYLFVFVEMEDKRGENKIYVYPDKARLGEGDLPSDYKEGESISFKYNSRVELPFGDIRPGASLARVSILLYGENGKILFQRGFEKKELSVVSAQAVKPDSSRQKTAAEKRRPL